MTTATTDVPTVALTAKDVAAITSLTNALTASLAAMVATGDAKTAAAAHSALAHLSTLDDIVSPN